jgi:3-phenylpropionate/cinnamic acid dioxygenase small subunit
MDCLIEHRTLLADIELLYTLYAEALDDGEIGRWPDFFAHDDASYRITTRDNLDRGMALCLVLCEGQSMMRDRATALQKTVVYRHRLQRRMMSGIRVLPADGLDPNSVKVRSTFALFEALGDDPSRLIACGRSTDVIVQEGGALKFKDRFCVVDARVMPDSIVFPL